METPKQSAATEREAELARQEVIEESKRVDRLRKQEQLNVNSERKDLAPATLREEIGLSQEQTEQAIAEALEGLSAEEKQQLLLAVAGSAKLDPQVGLRLEQLALFEAICQETRKQLENPTTRMGKVGKWTGAVDQAAAKLRTEIESFYQHDIATIKARIIAGEKFADVAKDYPLIGRAVDKYGLDISDPKDHEALLQQYVKLQEYYRELRAYDMVAALSEKLLAEDFEAQLWRVSAERRAELRREAEGEVGAIRAEHESSWRSPSAEILAQGGKALSEKDITTLCASLAEERYKLLLTKEIAKNFSAEGLSPARRALWDAYNDCLDPQDEWFNASDATWDTVINEIAISAPLLLASGGTALIARGAFTAGARLVVGRMAVSQAAKFGARELGQIGAERIATWASSSVLKRGAIVGSECLVEGAVFETVNLGLQGQWIGDCPDWAQRVLVASAMMGLFRGANHISERAFTKTVLDSGAEVAKLTKLGELVGKIQNPAAREIAKQLLVKGHVEAATLFLLTAAQNGFYGGDLEEFMACAGNDLLHAYLTVGALKLCDGVIRAPGLVIDTVKPQGKPIAESGPPKAESSQPSPEVGPPPAAEPAKPQSPSPQDDIAWMFESLKNTREPVREIQNEALKDITRRTEGLARENKFENIDDRIARGDYGDILPRGPDSFDLGWKPEGTSSAGRVQTLPKPKVIEVPVQKPVEVKPVEPMIKPEPMREARPVALPEVKPEQSPEPKPLPFMQPSPQPTAVQLVAAQSKPQHAPKPVECNKPQEQAVPQPQPEYCAPQASSTATAEAAKRKRDWDLAFGPALGKQPPYKKHEDIEFMLDPLKDYPDPSPKPWRIKGKKHEELEDDDQLQLNRRKRKVRSNILAASSKDEPEQEETIEVLELVHGVKEITITGTGSEG